MEDKFTNQEEQLRALTEDFSLDIDTSELWDNIEGQLPPVQNEKRRPVFWWFASAVFIIIIGLMALYNQSLHQQIELIAKKSLHKSQNIKPQNIESQNIESIISSESETKHTENSPLTTIVTDSNSHPSKRIASSENDPILKQNIGNQFVAKNNNLATLNSSSYDEKPRSWKEEVKNQSSVGVMSIGALINPSITPATLKELTSLTQERILITSVLLSSSQLKLLENKMKYITPSLEIKPVQITRWLPYFAFSSGSYLNKSSIFSNSSKGINLAQFANEKSLFGIRSDLRFGYESNTGWRFGLGLSHNRLVSRFTQDETVTTQDVIDGSESFKIDGEGNVVYLNGSLNQTTITNYNLNWHRKHDFINAQINVGKRIFQKGKLALFADATFSKNIWSQHKGYYFTEESNTITKFSNGEDNPYSNAGYNTGLSMDLEYRINKYSISLRPFATIGLNSITQNSNYYQLKNSQYGIQLGVVYRP